MADEAGVLHLYWMDLECSVALKLWGASHKLTFFLCFGADWYGTEVEC